MRQLLLQLVLCIVVAPFAHAQELKGLDGASHRLGDFVGHGQWVMLNLWSPGCTHCVEELPSLIAFHDDNAVPGMVVGVAMAYPGFGLAEAADIAAFAEDNGVNFPILLADGKLAGEFIGEKVDLVPLTLAYDPQGHLVARWHGVITLADIHEIIRDFGAP